MRTTTVWWLLLVASSAFGQQPQPASGTSRVIAPRDTTPLLYTLMLSPETAIPDSDTMPDKNFRQYNPGRRQLIDWANLGNFGSASMPMLFSPASRLGFSVGVDAWDPFRIYPEQLAFYKHSSTFSDVFFSQGPNQLENSVKAKLSRTFTGGTNLSLDYRTVNNLGQYQFQKVKHNALAVGVWAPLGKRWTLFAVGTKNVNRQEENGGLASANFGEGPFDGPISAAINLPDQKANTRVDDQRIVLRQYFDFVQKKQAARAVHQVAWVRERYKFSDPGPVGDISYLTPYLIDKRGVRNSIALDRLENRLALSTYSVNTGDKGIQLEAGLLHNLFWLRQEEPDSRFSNLFLTGKIGLKPLKSIALSGSAELGLLGAAGEFRLQSALTLDLGKIGRLEGALTLQRYAVPLLYNQLYISRRRLWLNDFKKPFENGLSARYLIPRLGFSAGASAWVVDNYLYFDQSGMPAQSGGDALSVFHLFVREEFAWRGLRFDNTFAIQRSGSDVVRLPEWFSQNSLYYSGKIFGKKMRVEAGVDFKINAAFTPNTWNPVVWQFQLQDTITQKEYPWIDLFVSFKVQSFRFFFRFENLNTFFDNKAVFYQTAPYAQPFAALRFGVGWRFMDGVQAATPQGGGGAQPPPGVGGFRN